MLLSSVTPASVVSAHVFVAMRLAVSRRTGMSPYDLESIMPSVLDILGSDIGTSNPESGRGTSLLLIVVRPRPKLPFLAPLPLAMFIKSSTFFLHDRQMRIPHQVHENLRPLSVKQSMHATGAYWFGLSW